MLGEAVKRAWGELPQHIQELLLEEALLAPAADNSDELRLRCCCTAVTRGRQSAPERLSAQTISQKNAALSAAFSSSLRENFYSPPASTARTCSSGPKSSALLTCMSSASRVRARLTRDLMVPTAQPQMFAASS